MVETTENRSEEDVTCSSFNNPVLDLYLLC